MATNRGTMVSVATNSDNGFDGNQQSDNGFKGNQQNGNDFNVECKGHIIWEGQRKWRCGGRGGGAECMMLGRLLLIEIVIQQGENKQVTTVLTDRTGIPMWQGRWRDTGKSCTHVRADCSIADWARECLLFFFFFFLSPPDAYHWQMRVVIRNAPPSCVEAKWCWSRSRSTGWMHMNCSADVACFILSCVHAGCLSPDRELRRRKCSGHFVSVGDSRHRWNVTV